MKQFFRNNGGLLLVAAVLLAGVLMVGAYILGYDPLSGALELLATPFRAASSAVAGWTQEQYDKSFRYEQAQAEIDALRRRVAELERDAIAGQEAQRENERMRDLLGLAEQRPELQYRDAAVVRRASSNWTSDLTINRGTSGGVEAGDCVIDQYGHLIGVVTQADLNSSLVTTILDPTLELGGRIARTDEDAILKGDFSLMLEGLARLSYLPEEARLVTGDQVITSGLGGVYPPGLAVGTVRSLITEEDGLTRYAQVEPAADIGGVQYVYVIVDYGA
ncbi:MAG: rod shape-determining protein MreC [Oscillospiraceae bacterium]|jgi:rod shape-determining protein MreC|nr:rod shape-determining protein MreC [Oscillospiraceae bacterium]